MTNSSQITAPLNQDRGVEYNIKITKRKQKDNIIEMTSSSLSFCGDSTPPSSCPLDPGQTEAALPRGEVPGAIAHPTPPTDLIQQDMVVKSYLQLFKNDDKNYKLKIRLNLIDGTDADFIAKLTTDRRNFTKYLPPECGTWFKDWSDCQVADIKQKFGVKPYRGKFHLAQEYRPGRKILTQVEPWCQCVVWYNPEQRQWWAGVSIYEFELMRPLTQESITLAQQRRNLHCQDIWINPKHDQRQRPKTFWQIRMSK
jgi:hypothetical protein